MPLFGGSDEKDAKRREKEAAEAATAYAASPKGRAEKAWEAGDGWFQIELSTAVTRRTVSGVMSGGKDTVTERTAEGHPSTLTDIESIGWTLFDVGYVFRPTGSVSRDKMLSSGQVESIQGEIIGIYLFRRNQ